MQTRIQTFLSPLAMLAVACVVLAALAASARAQAVPVPEILPDETALLRSGALKTTRQTIHYSGRERPGTIIINTGRRTLSLILRGHKALRYRIGVGRDGFEWKGRHRISRKVKWPVWIPPKEMLQRQPYLPGRMPGGLYNPLGARAIYLGSTLYRVHGTIETWTVGDAVSSGCFRMLNDDVIDLYDRVHLGATVVVN